MSIQDTITLIRRDLIRSFAVLDECFDKIADNDNYTMYTTLWPEKEKLEQALHVTQSTLDSIEDSSVLALQAAEITDLQDLLLNYSFEASILQRVMGHQILLEKDDDNHLARSKSKTLTEIRLAFRSELNCALYMLELLHAGEGVIIKNTSHENSYDIYQLIYALALFIKEITLKLLEPNELNTPIENI